MTMTVGTNRFEPCRIFCVGMNYVAHIRELNNTVPESPVIFMKPVTSLIAPGEPLLYPPHGRDLHYETEVVVVIGQAGRPETENEVRSMIGGLSLGLDMTLRDLQLQLRPKGNPWELCKAFEGSAPLGNPVPLTSSMDLANLPFTGSVNGQIRQNGNTSDLLFSITTLIQYLAGIWTLRPGDLIYTGTPVGVGAVVKGDHLEVAAPWFGRASWTVT